MKISFLRFSYFFLNSNTLHLLIHNYITHQPGIVHRTSLIRNNENVIVSCLTAWLVLGHTTPCWFVLNQFNTYELQLYMVQNIYLHNHVFVLRLFRYQYLVLMTHGNFYDISHNNRQCNSIRYKENSIIFSSKHICLAFWCVSVSWLILWYVTSYWGILRTSHLKNHSLQLYTVQKGTFTIILNWQTLHYSWMIYLTHRCNPNWY